MNFSRFLVIVTLTFFFLWFPPIVDASEGRISLFRNGAACEAVSIWRVGVYRVFGRCSGFVYPYAEGYSTYVLWGVPSDGSRNLIRISEIDEGYIDGRSDRPFSQVFITAEKESFPAVAEGYRIIESEIVRFPFESGISDTNNIDVSPPLLMPLATIEPLSTPSGFSLGRIFGTVSLLVFVVITVVVIGVLVLIWRASTR